MTATAQTRICWTDGFGLKMFNKGFILTSVCNQIWLRIYKENYQEWND